MDVDSTTVALIRSCRREAPCAGNDGHLASCAGDDGHLARCGRCTHSGFCLLLYWCRAPSMLWKLRATVQPGPTGSPHSQCFVPVLGHKMSPKERQSGEPGRKLPNRRQAGDSKQISAEPSADATQPDQAGLQLPSQADASLRSTRQRTRAWVTRGPYGCSGGLEWAAQDTEGAGHARPGSHGFPPAHFHQAHPAREQKKGRPAHAQPATLESLCSIAVAADWFPGL